MAGELDVPKLARTMTARGFQAWELYWSVEPFGDLRADWHAAAIAQMIFNMAVDVKDRNQTLDDFRLKFADAEEPVKKKPQTFEEQIAIAKIMAMSMAAGAKEKDK